MVTANKETNLPSSIQSRSGGSSSASFGTAASSTSLASSTTANTLQSSGIDDAIINLDAFTFEAFFTLYRKFCSRPDVEAIFLNICGKVAPSNNPTALTTLVTSTACTVAQLKQFLNDYQRDPRHNEILKPFFNSHQVKQLINKYEQDKSLRERGQLSYSGFFRFLLSESDPIEFKLLTMSQDLDQPLTHYYISTSHNTYLTGRQINSKSSVEMYRQVLLSGCRSVELDTWDGDNDEPMITHGKAMCTKINYKEVLESIKATAFVTSCLPVVLSFENHCSRRQQLKLATYAEEVFGDLLFKDPHPDHPLVPGVPLPSPNKLRRKILIKNKRLPPEIEQQQLELYQEGLLIQEANDTAESAEISPEFVDEVVRKMNTNIGVDPPSNNSSSSKTIGKTGSDETSTTIAVVDGTDGGTDCSTGGASGGQSDKTHLVLSPQASTSLSKTTRKNAISSLTAAEEAAIAASYQYQGATSNIHPYLSKMVNYCQAIKFQDFESAESKNFNQEFKIKFNLIPYFSRTKCILPNVFFQ